MPTTFDYIFWPRAFSVHVADCDSVTVETSYVQQDLRTLYIGDMYIVDLHDFGMHVHCTMYA